MWRQDPAFPQRCASSPSSEVGQYDGPGPEQPSHPGSENPLLMPPAPSGEHSGQGVWLLPSGEPLSPDCSFQTGQPGALVPPPAPPPPPLPPPFSPSLVLIHNLAKLGGLSHGAGRRGGRWPEELQKQGWVLHSRASLGAGRYLSIALQCPPVWALPARWRVLAPWEWAVPRPHHSRSHRAAARTDVASHL